MDRKRVNKSDLLFPELSYQLIGVLFDVHNTLGYGYQEKYYQKAIAVLLKKLKIPFREHFESCCNDIILNDLIGQKILFLFIVIYLLFGVCYLSFVTYPHYSGIVFVLFELNENEM